MRWYRTRTASFWRGTYRVVWSSPRPITWASHEISLGQQEPPLQTPKIHRKKLMVFELDNSRETLQSACHFKEAMLWLTSQITLVGSYTPICVLEQYWFTIHCATMLHLQRSWLVYLQLCSFSRWSCFEWLLVSMSSGGGHWLGLWHKRSTLASKFRKVDFKDKLLAGPAVTTACFA